MSTDMAVDHVNGNGTEESAEPMDTMASEVTEVAEGARSEHFQTLLDAGLPQKVAEKLDEVYIAGELVFVLKGPHDATRCVSELSCD